MKQKIMITCPNCKKNINANNKFCPLCEKELVSNSRWLYHFFHGHQGILWIFSTIMVILVIHDYNSSKSYLLSLSPPILI